MSRPELEECKKACNQLMVKISKEGESSWFCKEADNKLIKDLNICPKKDRPCSHCGKLLSEHGGPYNGIYYACPPFVEFKIKEVA